MSQRCLHFYVSLLCFAINCWAQPIMQLRQQLQLDFRPALRSQFDYAVQVSAFSVDDAGIHFLITPQVTGGGLQALIDFHLDGKLSRIVRLRKPVEARWMQRDQASGRTYLWKVIRSVSTSGSSGLSSVIYAVGNDGEQSEVATFPGAIRYPALLDSSVWGITETGCIRQGTSTVATACGIKAADPSGMSTLYRQASAGELVAFESSTATLISLSPASGVLKTKRVVAPEIQRAMNFYRTDPFSAMIVKDIAVLSPKHLLASVSGHPLTGGSVVLELDREGNVSRSLRCPLASHPDLRAPGNEQGFALSSFMGFSNGNVFFSDRNGVVFSCTLPYSSD